MDAKVPGASTSALPSGDSPYRAPVDEYMVALEVAGLTELLKLDCYRDIDTAAVRMVLEEFGRLASQVIAPTNRTGDIEGATYHAEDASVTLPASLRQAYARYVEGGWGALPFSPAFGGGGFPGSVGLAMQEIFASANLALSLNPVLTQGAIEALLQWGSDEQKAAFLPRLLTGEWTGTMNLTEPDAGSDLGAIRTAAHFDGEQWFVSGTKIFITWGEHDLSENIIHLVLARTPDAPAGTKGLSLFAVPKFIESSGEASPLRNALRCLRVEEKLGIHASPTCVMAFDGARGQLVGPLHGGMQVMFTMMNAARLSIGSEGPGVGERVLQAATAYARDRRQGRAETASAPVPSAIIEHPDVQRMLLRISTTTKASRMLLLTVKSYEDQARYASSDADRERGRNFADLLTPVAKAWATDIGFGAASEGVQVLGGVGYVEEFGMAQYLRDARIGPIYEGTNGIQALDLILRKIPRDQGRWLRELTDQMRAVIPEGYEPSHALAPSFRGLREAIDLVGAASEWMLEQLEQSRIDAVAGATPYLQLLAVTAGAYLMTRRALSTWSGDEAARQRAVGECNFFVAHVLSSAKGFAEAVTFGVARDAKIS